MPAWFQDAKLGIFVHWGLYSVPGWAPLAGDPKEVIAAEGWSEWFAHNPYAEWYLNSIRIEGSASHRYHVETYGQGFGYDEFIPAFDEATEDWDPGTWAELFSEAGARYVVLTTKHHDGFLLWPSEHPNPFREHYHSQRNLVGDLTEAVRERGMRMGLYYSGGIDWTFNDLVIRDIGDLIGAVPQSADYVAYANSHWQELIDRYRPAVMWNDIGYPAGADLPALFARYYDAVPDGVVNDRFAQFRVPKGRLIRAMLNTVLPLALRWLAKRGRGTSLSTHADFTTPEYATYSQIVEKKWEATRGIGYSFGYNRGEGPDNYLSVQELIHSFVDIVSKNGNLLLNVGPMADGTIPEMQRERLEALGRWLRVNGEAIYGTRPWVRAEGSTGEGTGVRFTQHGDSLYAVVLGALEGSDARVRRLEVQDGTVVALLGHDGPLAWRQEGSDLAVSLPERPSGAPAYALKITPAPHSL